MHSSPCMEWSFCSAGIVVGTLRVLDGSVPLRWLRTALLLGFGTISHEDEHYYYLSMLFCSGRASTDPCQPATAVPWRWLVASSLSLCGQAGVEERSRNKCHAYGAEHGSGATYLTLGLGTLGPLGTGESDWEPGWSLDDIGHRAPTAKGPCSSTTQRGLVACLHEKTRTFRSHWRCINRISARLAPSGGDEGAVPAFQSYERSLPQLQVEEGSIPSVTLYCFWAHEA